MDEDRPASSPKKLRFAPKATDARRLRKAPPPPRTLGGSAVSEGPKDGEAQARRPSHLMGNLMQQKAKVEKNSSVQVAFDYGARPSRLVRVNRVSKDGNISEICGSGFQSSDKEDCISLAPSVDDTGTSSKMKREYNEPWDYDQTNYPTTLPLRRPCPGDPELLDEAEFGGAARDSEYDEADTNPAMELGLMEDGEDVRFIFFQIPPDLPLAKRSVSSERKKMGNSSVPSVHASASARKGCNLDELSEGYMGKMMVYKSGALKLKLGEVLYDVSPGSDCSFVQDMVAINTVEKNCCCLGKLDKKAVVSPDIDSLLHDVG